MPVDTAEQLAAPEKLRGKNHQQQRLRERGHGSKGWEGMAVAFLLTWVLVPPGLSCNWSQRSPECRIKPSPAQGEQPDRSWLSAPQSRAQTRCDCASDSAEWSRQHGTGSLQ